MAGWNDLGELLGGGTEARKENAFQQGRYRSAQTEDALTNARVNQAKAIQAEAENNARSELAAMQSRGEIDYGNPTSDLITQALLGGRGSDLPHAGNFNLQAQEFRNRNVLGDQASSAESRLRAGEAVQGKVQGDIQSVGTKGYYNLADDNPELSVMAGLADPTTTNADYDRFVALGGNPGPESFMDIKRNQYRVTNIGDVPNQVRTGAAPVVTPLAATADVAKSKAQIAGASAGARTTATTQAKLANALPGVVESLDTFAADIDNFTKSPGFDMVYGKSGAAASAMNPILQPEEYRNANALLMNLNSEAFLNSIQKMRGLGSLSNAEGEKVEAALTSALERGQDEGQAAQSFKLLKSRLERFRRIAELEAGMSKVPGVNVGTGAVPPTAVQDFATLGEAEAAGLLPGTKITIGGRRATVQ
jgi:hypothetical protein